MKECFQHTDLEWRLQQIPDTAMCRGVFLNMLDERAKELGPRTQTEYRAFFTTHKFSAFRQYPVKDYLTRMVKLSQIHFGAENIYHGIFEIQAQAYPSWRKTVLGAASFAVLGSDFDRILRLVIQQLPHVVNYATASIEAPSAGQYDVTFRGEYVYIEHAMTGALSGLARSCGREAKVSTKLQDPFNGSVHIELAPGG
jgi:uncharacterized protein (TIGR02265 family)